MSNQFSGYLLVSCYSPFVKTTPVHDEKMQHLQKRSLVQTPPSHLHAKHQYRNQFLLPLCACPCRRRCLPHLPTNNPSLPHRADGVVAPPQQFLQSGLCRVFLRGVHVLPIVPVASRDRKPGDGDVARPGGTLASTVREDLVFWR